ncbi:LacI family DNA-binding transcriptional regulator [Streptomyces sp. NPDC000410]|uniref:LacI family DNA-binding transcriptional regulator n=1 Tax=Streptomyces sp. NPDC000410 TaxID=3154254 RepID=UPI0033270B46
MSRVTIADIARAAEVSTATVSNALSGRGRLSEATRTRVRAVAAALDYAGASAAPRTLGLAVTTYGPFDWNFASVPYFARAISAATAAAHARGYALIALPAAAREPLWRSVPVAGVVVLDSPPDDPVVGLLRERGLPLVFDGRPVELRRRESWVDNDHAATTREVLGHLAARGAERIALMAGPGEEHYTLACTSAYRAWCAERAVRPVIVPLDFDDADGRMLDPLLSGAGRPDAVHGLYDPCGHQLLAAAARLGLRVPDDLLLVCASEDPGYARTAPPVSTVSLVPELTTAAAVGKLVDLIETPESLADPSVVPARLEVRASSGGVARGLTTGAVRVRGE